MDHSGKRLNDEWPDCYHESPEPLTDEVNMNSCRPPIVPVIHSDSIPLESGSNASASILIDKCREFADSFPKCKEYLDARISNEAFADSPHKRRGYVDYRYVSPYAEYRNIIPEDSYMCDFTSQNEKNRNNLKLAMNKMNEWIAQIAESVDNQFTNDLQLPQYHDDVVIESNKQLLIYAFQCDFLLFIIAEYISFAELFPIAVYLNKIDVLSQSYFIQQMMFTRMFNFVNMFKATPELYIHEIASIFRDKCINGSMAPFLVLRTSKDSSKCTSYKTAFNKYQAVFYYGKYSHYNNFADYLLFATSQYHLFKRLFKDTELLHYINLFSPFCPSHLVTHNGLIHDVDTDDHGQFQTSIKGNNIPSKTLQSQFLQLWTDFPELSGDAELVINDFKTFHVNLTVAYRFVCWYNLVDWNYFFVGGGSLLSSLIGSASIHSSPASDVNLFSYNLTNEEFNNIITTFQHNLRKRGIAFQMNQLNGFKVTFILIWDEILRPNHSVQIQFIWTCAKATISEVLLSFDLAASQIAFIPNPNNISKSKLLVTDPCRYYLNTGKCMVFNFDSKRIKKYQQKGVTKFLVPSDKYNEYLQRWNQPVNKESNRAQHGSIAIKINDDAPIILSINRNRDFEQTGHCNYEFKSCNVDYRGLFYKFISELHSSMKRA